MDWCGEIICGFTQIYWYAINQLYPLLYQLRELSCVPIHWRPPIKYSKRFLDMLNCNVLSVRLCCHSSHCYYVRIPLWIWRLPLFFLSLLCVELTQPLKCRSARPRIHWSIGSLQCAQNVDEEEKERKTLLNWFWGEYTHSHSQIIIIICLKKSKWLAAGHLHTNTEFWRRATASAVYQNESIMEIIANKL